MIETSTAEERPGRRGLLAAAAGMAGAAMAMAVSQTAQAETVSTTTLDWYNVMDYKAVGNGTTDDTAAVQAAIDAAAAGGIGGTVYFPAGQYLVTPGTNGPNTPALTVPATVVVAGAPEPVPVRGIRLVGASSRASTLVKGGPGILLRMSGTGPDLSSDANGSTHLSYCAIEDLGFNGNNKTGLLLELYYTDNCYVRDVYMSDNNDICIDGVEFWDSRFYNLAIAACTGSEDSTTQPNIWLRNSSATSGWGYSTDNVNQIHFIGCRLEDFGTGALWITQGSAGTNNPNGIYLTDCKFETTEMQGGPHLKVDSSCKHVYASNIYAFAGGFATGYTKPQNIISWAGIASALENVLIANGSTGTINSGVDLYSGGTSTAVLRNVVGLYTTAPTGSHIYYEASSTGDFRVENSYGSTGQQAGGTLPTRNQANPPLRLIQGPVSDASFTSTPADGTLAVDSSSQTPRLYVRVGGAWLWTTLNT